MRSRTQVLAQRREALLARSDALRAELGLRAAAISGSFALLDRGVALARSGKLRPLLAIAAVALLAVRPRLAWRLASRSAMLLPLARRLLPLARTLVPVARRALPHARRLVGRLRARVAARAAARAPAVPGPADETPPRNLAG